MCRGFISAPQTGQLKTYEDVRLIKVGRLRTTGSAREPRGGRYSRGHVSEIHKLRKKGDIISPLSASNQKWRQTLCCCPGQAARQEHGMNDALSPVWRAAALT